MRNERLHDGDRVTLPVPADTDTGTPVLVGSLIGVTATAEGGGGNIAGRATVWRKGEFDVEVPDAVASEGLPIYITDAGALTTTATANTLFGYSHADADGNGGTKSAGAGTIHVILAQV